MSEAKMYIMIDDDDNADWHYRHDSEFGEPFTNADRESIYNLEVGQVYHKSGTGIAVVRVKL